MKEQIGYIFTIDDEILCHALVHFNVLENTFRTGLMQWQEKKNPIVDFLDFFFSLFVTTTMHKMFVPRLYLI